METRFALSITTFAIADRFEPNDSFDNAKDLEIVFGRREESGLSIHSDTDEDWFQFVLPAAGTKADYVDLLFNHANGDLDALLYDATRTVKRTSRNSFDNERLSLDGLASGTYHIRVFGSNQSLNDSYTLVVQTHLWKPDRLEPNDVFPGRHLGVVNGQRTFRDLAVSSFDDVDYYGFFLPYGGMEHGAITVVFSHSTGDLDVRLREANGKVIDESESTTDDERLSLAGLPPGEYVLEVFGFEATNSYDLEFLSPQVWDPEPCAINIDTLIANIVRPTLTGTIECDDASIFVQVGEFEPRPVPNPGTGEWVFLGSELPVPLPEGDHEIVAWTTNSLGDYAEDRGTLTIDLTAPVARFYPVPTPRSSGLASLRLAFTETIVGLDIHDLILTRNDTPVSVESVSPDGEDGEYLITVLESLTNSDGSYTLRLRAIDSGIQDRAGNLLAESAEISWEVRPDVSGGAVWAFLLEPATVSEFAVDSAGIVYVAGHYSGSVNFNPISPNPFLLETDSGKTLGFVASYDASGLLIQVTKTDFAVSQLSVDGNWVAAGGVLVESGVSTGVVQIFDVKAAGNLTAKQVISLPYKKAEGTHPGSVAGVSITELLLTSDRQVFLSGVISSGEMTLDGGANDSVAVRAAANQADGFVAAFTPLGEAAWAMPLLAPDWNTAPIFPNSLAYEPKSQTLAFGVILSRSIGLIPKSIPFNFNIAMAIGLHANTGTYRWAVPVIEGALDAIDTVALVATPDGLIHAAAHAFIHAQSSGEFSLKSGRVAAAVMTVDPRSGEYVPGPDLNDLLGRSGDLYVSDLTDQPGGTALLAVTRFGGPTSGANGQELLLIVIAPSDTQGTQQPLLWSAPLKGWTSQVRVAGDNRVVMKTAVDEKTKFPGEPPPELIPVASSQAIWSIKPSFLPFPSENMVVNVPSGETRLQGEPFDGGGAVVKRGDGILILDRANTHLGGLIVESGTVVVRHRNALNGGRLEGWDGARIEFDSTSPDLGEAIIVVKELRLIQDVVVDLQRSGIQVATGGFEWWSLRQAVLTSDILSSTANHSGGTRTVGYLLKADGSALVAFAAPGDTDLNRQVNVFDLVNINSSGKFASGRQATWPEGDFNHDSLTNVFDLVKINTGGTYGNGAYAGNRVSEAAISFQPLSITSRPTSDVALTFAWLAEEQKESNSRKPFSRR